MVVAANDGELAARLHFEAEHTNVLVVTVELLNGCLASTEIENMTAKIITPTMPEFPVRHAVWCSHRLLISTSPAAPAQPG